MNMEPEQIPKELFQPAGAQLQQPVLPRSVGGRRAAAWGRFRKNGSSVVAAVVLALLLAFALIVPMVMPYGVEFRDGYYKNALPKLFPNRHLPHSNDTLLAFPNFQTILQKMLN